MARMPNPELAQQWRRRLDRFEQVDLTVREFCRRENCSVGSFYQWRRKLRLTHRGDNQGDEQVIEAPAFVAVNLPPERSVDRSISTIQLELPCGWVVRFDAHCPEQALQTSVRAVLHAASAGASPTGAAS